jgi:hypothetical protein
LQIVSYVCELIICARILNYKTIYTELAALTWECNAAKPAMKLRTTKLCHYK